MAAVLKRNDVHRPSAIIPEDYQFVVVLDLPSEYDPIEQACHAVEARKLLNAHMSMTGGKYSQHEHGGSCHVCGARASYLAAFYHEPSNSYIQVGQDCCEKLDMGHESDFRKARTLAEAFRNAKAGKLKAAAVLQNAGAEKAWELFNLSGGQLVEMGLAQNAVAYDGVEYARCIREYNTLKDIVDKLIKYGSISSKQMDYLKKLVDFCSNAKQKQEEREAKKEAEYEAAAKCVPGRYKIVGEVLSIKAHESDYGTVLKMLVKSDEGYKVYGSVPSSIASLQVQYVDEHGDERVASRGLDRGDRVEFVATVSVSDNDPKFGFFSRPTKAECLTSQDFSKLEKSWSYDR